MNWLRVVGLDRIGQMAQIDKVYIKNKKDITTYGLGSLISGGSGQGEENGTSGFADMVDDFMQVQYIYPYMALLLSRRYLGIDAPSALTCFSPPLASSTP